MFGPPNDEALAGHPLTERGLRSYSVFRMENSSLIRSLERMNSVHRSHKAAAYDALSHHIFAFK